MTTDAGITGRRTSIGTIVLATLMALGSIASGSAQEISGKQKLSKTEAAVLKTERERGQALQNCDMAVLDRIHADDLTFVNTRGQVLTKAQYMDEIRSGTLKFLSIEQDDYRFHTFGDTVVVTGRSGGIVEYQGKTNRAPRRFTIVYIKRHGQWQFVAYQGTVIAVQ
jgi:ketosteroid isomerase-like protein